MLHIDLGEFYTSMYAQMIRISMDPNASILTANVFDEDRNTTLGGAADAVEHLSLGVKCEIELLLQGLELMFFRKKQIPLARVTAFVKRVAVMSLSMAPSGILACLAMIRSLMVRFPKLDSLFDAESRVGTGVYSPYLDDPELCNAVTSNLWEISHLTVIFLCSSVNSELLTQNVDTLPPDGAKVCSSHSRNVNGKVPVRCQETN